MSASRYTLSVAAAALIWTCLAGDAAAQPKRWDNRVIVTANGAAQVTTTDFADRVTFRRNLEDEAIDVDYKVDTAGVFGGGAMVRLWRDLGIGVAGSRFEQRAAVPVRASIPHPFFFNRDRAIDGESGRLTRRDTALHVEAIYLVPVSAHVNVALSGGPSFFRIEQQLVSDVTFAEEYPYDTATFTGVVAEREKRDATGFNAGVDTIWRFSRYVGAGVLVRFTKASTTLTPAGRSVKVDAGGLHVGGGLRILF